MILFFGVTHNRPVSCWIFLNHKRNQLLENIVAKLNEDLSNYIDELLIVKGKIAHLKNVAALRLILDRTLEDKAKEIGITKQELDDFLGMLRE
jgi:hypothetical protein